MDELFEKLSAEIVSLKEKVAELEAEVARLTRLLADAVAMDLLKNAGFSKEEDVQV